MSEATKHEPTPAVVKHCFSERERDEWANGVEVGMRLGGGAKRFRVEKSKTIRPGLDTVYSVHVWHDGRIENSEKIYR